MEPLELLERRVASLIAEITALRKENTKLRKALSGNTSSLTQENNRLKLSLGEEQQAREAMQKRLEALLLLIDGEG